MYSSRDELERGNNIIQGYSGRFSCFQDFRFVRLQDFSKDFGISRKISEVLYEISG